MRSPRLPLFALLSSLGLVACSSSSAGGDAFVVPTDAPGPIAFGEVAEDDFLARHYVGRGAMVDAHVRVDPNTTCTSEPVGECRLSTCVTTGSQPLTPLDPGALTVSSTVLGGADLPVTVNPVGYGQLQKTTSFTVGDAVQLKGAGGVDFPAFDVSTTIPRPVESLRLHGCASSPCSIPATGAVLTWEGATGATVVAAFTSGNMTLSCRFAGDAGKGSVPASVIAKMIAAGTWELNASSESPTTKLVAGKAHSLKVGAVAPGTQRLVGTTTN